MRKTADTPPGFAPLTPKQQRFVGEYLVDLNATQAAIRAGYSAKTAGEQASKLLMKLDVQQAVAAARGVQQERTQITADRVLREIARLALSDPRGIVDEDGRLKRLHEIDDATAATVAAYEVDSEGSIKYKFWDKNSALEKLAKHLGLYERDNQQRTDPLASLLHTIAKSNGNGFRPVADDPERTPAPKV